MTEPNAQNPAENAAPKDSSDAAQAAAGSSQPSSPEARIAELEGKLKEQESKYLYLYADFENHKKRAVKDRSELIKFGWENVARDLLGVLDNLDRAVNHLPPGTDKTFAEGLKMIVNQFQASLSKQGVTPVSSQGTFDPMLHEAVGQEDSDQPAGSIVQQLTQGYTLHGRLLRPARVLVSSGKKAPTVN